MHNFISLINLSCFSHFYILYFCVLIFIFVILIFLFLFYNKSYNTIFSTYFYLEYFWTFCPIIIVLLLFIPLFFFTSDDIFLNSYFCFANQWFWDFAQLEIEVSELVKADFFYINCNIIYLSKAFYSFFLSSNDVIHAFSIPCLYVMVDVVPGLLHNISFFFPYSGLYSLYCNQICGVNHSEMSLCLYVV